MWAALKNARGHERDRQKVVATMIASASRETPVRTAVEHLLQPCERLIYDLFSVDVLPYRTHSTTGPRRSEVP